MVKPDTRGNWPGAEGPKADKGSSARGTDGSEGISDKRGSSRGDYSAA